MTLLDINLILPFSKKTGKTKQKTQNEKISNNTNNGELKLRNSMDALALLNAAGIEYTYIPVSSAEKSLLPLGYKLKPLQLYSFSKYSCPEVKIGNKTINLNNLWKQKNLKNNISISIGRSNDCDFQISDDTTISRRHLQVIKNNDEYLIQDLGSTNGTYVCMSSSISNPEELCRVKGNNNKKISEIYIKNNELARQEFINGIASGKSIFSVNGYVNTLNKAHIKAYQGAGLLYR